MAELTLLDLLTETVRTYPDLTSAVLAKRLKSQGLTDVDKHVLNRILYSYPQRFRRVDAYKPRWRWIPQVVPPHGLENPEPRRPAGVTLYERQRQALQAWRANGSRGVVEAVTGAGKTHVGIAATVEGLTRGNKVLVLVPTIELLQQWYEKLLVYVPGARVNRLGAGRKANFRTSDVIVATVQSARKSGGSRFSLRGEGLLIADECHRYGSECNKDALDEHFRYRLGLSATYGRNDNGTSDWLDPYFECVCFKLDYKQALRDRVIADFSAALLGVRFSEEERREYERVRSESNRLKKKLVNDHGLPESPFGEFIKEVERLRKVGSYKESLTAGKYLKAFKECRRLLAETPGKLDMLRKLEGAIKGADRTLLFTMTIGGVSLPQKFCATWAFLRNRYTAKWARKNGALCSRVLRQES